MGKQRPSLVRRVLPIVGIGLFGTLLYSKMLAAPPLASDRVQALEFTHSPELFRYSELACAVIAAVLCYGIRHQRTKLTEPATLFTFSLLLTPFLVFNQQIITGRSLQPYHYEFYIANYLTVLAGVLAASILFKERMRKVAVLIGCVALFWGWGEVAISEHLNRSRNIERDALMAVARNLKDNGTIYSRDIWVVSNHISTFTSLPVVWALHTQVCISLTPEEAKQRFYQYLYYTDYDPDELREDLLKKSYLQTAALFGYERAGLKLQESGKPVSADEVEQAVTEYAAYLSSFTYERSIHPKLSYVIATDSAPGFSRNLDRWYSRDEGKRIGEFILYRVKPRQQ